MSEAEQTEPKVKIVATTAKNLSIFSSPFD
jgi:hypothetical protein